MSTVQAELILDLSQAIAEVEQLAAEIDSVTSDVTLSLDVESTVDEVQSELDSLEASAVDVEVDADTSTAEAEINGLEGEPIDIPVEVSGAEQAATEVSDIGGAAESASSQMDGLSSATAGFGAAAGAAGGSADELVGALGSFGPAGAAAAAGIAAVAGASASLFSAAVESVGSTERFTQVLGSFAGQVDSVQLGDLNLSLEEFATLVGQDDEALRNSLTTLTAYGQASGVAADDTARYAEQITLLAGRAVALKPSLEIGPTIDGLSRVLATGGARLGRYGLDIGTVSERQEIANELFGRGFESLNRYEQSIVGAEAATRNLGSSLQRDIIAGSENVEVKLASLQESFGNAFETLGEPLILPVFDLLQAGIPVALSVAEALGSIAQAAIPLVSGYLDAIGPATEIVADGFADLATALEGVDLEPVFEAFSEQAVVSAETFAAALDLLAAVLPLLNFDPLVTGLELVTTLTENNNLIRLAELLGGPLPKSADAAASGIKEVTEAEEEAQAATEEFVNAAVGALPQAADAFENVAGQADKAAELFGIVVDSSDPALLTRNLNEMTYSILTFQSNLETLQGLGEDLDATFAEIAAAGPEEGGSLLQNLLEGTEEDRAAYEQALEDLETSTAGFSDFLSAEGAAGGSGWTEAVTSTINTGSEAVAAAAQASGDAASAGIGAGFGTVTGLLSAQMGLATATVAAQGATLTATGGTVGRSTGSALGLGFAGSVGSGVSLGMAVARNAVAGQGAALASTARSVGYQVGVSLGSGIASGIGSQVSQIAASARDAVNTAEAAARDAADASSPSRLFARLGKDMGDGLVVGFEDAASALVREAQAVTFAAAQGVGASGGSGTTDVGGIVVNQTISGDPSDSRTIRKAARDGVVEGAGLIRARTRFDAGVL